MDREPTSFEERVYRLTRTIPAGYVSTYGRLATALRCGSAQAVGQALRRNPFAPEVPCHRVVAGSRSIGGFVGEREGAQIETKIRMLRAEGVEFDAGLRVEEQCVHEFS